MIPYHDYFLLFPRIPTYNQEPPTVFSILESIVNYEKEPKTKVKDLAKEGRGKIFNFDYPLTPLISKEKFETMILNHFLMRRIGFETVTLFSIQLDIKLNSIMPLYNKMFESVENWNIFNDGEYIEKASTDNRNSETIAETINTLENNSTTTSNDTSDRRNSELPQSQLEDLRDGSYVSNYNYDTNTAESEDNSKSNGKSNSVNNTKDNNTYNEFLKRSPADKIQIYKEFQNNIKSIYDMIFTELEDLFYQLV